MFEYKSPAGTLIVGVEETSCYGLLRLTVSNGESYRILPLLLDENTVESTLCKLGKMPKNRTISFNEFSNCVAGAASLSMKYDYISMPP